MIGSVVSSAIKQVRFGSLADISDEGCPLSPGSGNAGRQPTSFDIDIHGATTLTLVLYGRTAASWRSAPDRVTFRYQDSTKPTLTVCDAIPTFAQCSVSK